MKHREKGSFFTRRDFLRSTLALATAMAAGGVGCAVRPTEASAVERSTGGKSRVVLIQTEDRREGISKALNILNPPSMSGKNVVLKPNFNSADPFPGGTHNDTLQTLVEYIGSQGAKKTTVADRSGMGDTRQVMRDKGIFDLGRSLGFDVAVLNELPADRFSHHKLEGSHWKRGVYFPKLFEEADAIVQTCCLKTHRFGGHFTLSLKNSVGMVAKFSPVDGYDFMSELHSSPFQRLMIAEINALYAPAFILLDGMKAFVDGGPDRGTVVEPKVIVAGTDRIAVDAVGVAILRIFGTTPQVSAGRIFGQEQISRAAELGLGASSAGQIEIVSDPESQDFAEKVRNALKGG
ncbi:MAG: DUF362 domain-containing protein [bacterium]